MSCLFPRDEVAEEEKERSCNWLWSFRKTYLSLRVAQDEDAASSQTIEINGWLVGWLVCPFARTFVVVNITCVSNFFDQQSVFFSFICAWMTNNSLIEESAHKNQQIRIHYCKVLNVIIVGRLNCTLMRIPTLRVATMLLNHQLGVIDSLVSCWCCLALAKVPVHSLAVAGKRVAINFAMAN